jgi:hypothetical protein
VASVSAIAAPAAIAAAAAAATIAAISAPAAGAASSILASMGAFAAATSSSAVAPGSSSPSVLARGPIASARVYEHKTGLRQVKNRARARVAAPNSDFVGVRGASDADEDVSGWLAGPSV